MLLSRCCMMLWKACLNILYIKSLDPLSFQSLPLPQNSCQSASPALVSLFRRSPSTFYPTCVLFATASCLVEVLYNQLTLCHQPQIYRNAASLLRYCCVQSASHCFALQICLWSPFMCCSCSSLLESFAASDWLCCSRHAVPDKEHLLMDCSAACHLQASAPQTRPSATLLTR